MYEREQSFRVKVTMQCLQLVKLLFAVSPLSSCGQQKKEVMWFGLK